MMDIATFSRLYGYPAVIVATMLQGEAVLLVCGFLAHQGYLSVWGVWAAATASAMIGDVSYFNMGRWWGERLIAKLPRFLRGGINRARNMIDRHPNKVMLSMRFLFGMRILLPILCGVSTIRQTVFLRYNFVTAFVWSALFVWLGWLFGVAAQPLIREVEHVEGYIILGLAVAGIFYNYAGKYVREHWSSNNHHKESQ